MNLTRSQRDSIRRLLETNSTPKSEIARRFNCSTQTIHRIFKEVKAERAPMRERSESEVAVKKDLDAAFGAFERCNSRANYERLHDCRHNSETVCGSLAKVAPRATVRRVL